jgi:hypothetical protein
MMAADTNNSDIVRVLLQAGANPKTQDHRAGTALSRAKEKNYSVVAGLLADAVAARDKKDAAARASSGSSRGARADSTGSNEDMAPKRRSSSSSSGRGVMAGKAALGSKATDLFAGGRASAAEDATKERMKGRTFKAASLDSSLGGRG